MNTLMILAIVSLQQFAVESVENRLRDADPSVTLRRFCNYPIGASKDQFGLNPKFWAKGIDFSCVSPWNSAGGSLRAGTLISKRHIIFAKHFPLWKGVRILFVGEDGGVCPCYIEKTKALEKCDVMIGSLNVEVTPNIHPAKILPDDYSKYIGNGEGVPIGAFNQREMLLLAESEAVPTNGAPFPCVSIRPPADKGKTGFRARIVTGDSGNPAFFIFGNQAVLACCLYSPTSGPAPHLYRREIQKAMDELCPGYRLETFDFEKVRCEDGKCEE